MFLSEKISTSKITGELGDGDHVAASRGSSANSTTSNAVQNGVDSRISSNANLLGDALDRKIELLLRDWHNSPDLLFAIHPVDGSFLVW